MPCVTLPVTEGGGIGEFAARSIAASEYWRSPLAPGLLNARPSGVGSVIVPSVLTQDTKDIIRIVVRAFAVLLVAWSAVLAFHSPTITRTTTGPGNSVTLHGTHQCDAPISYVFTDDWRDASSRSTTVSEKDPAVKSNAQWEEIDQACRDRAIGTGVEVGLLGNVVALLLGFTRPRTRGSEKPRIPW